MMPLAAMRSSRRLVAVLGLVLAVAGASSTGASTTPTHDGRVGALATPRPLRGLATFAVCRGAHGIPIPQYTIAYGFGSLWIACRANGTLERRDLTGRLRASIRVGIHPWVVSSGFGAVWALERDGSVVRVSATTNKVTARINPGEPAVYLWAEPSGVWLAMDDQSAFRRLNPSTNRVGPPIGVGLNPSGLVQQGTTIWVTCHGDQTLWRIDGSAHPQQAAKLVGGAPERIVATANSLWVTGRGTQLLQIDPQTAQTSQSITIGAGGIDLAEVDGHLWVATANAANDHNGLPRVQTLVKIDATTGSVLDTRTATGQLFLTGLTSDNRHVWLADTQTGLLIRLPA